MPSMPVSAHHQCRYPEVVRTRASRELSARMREAAEAERVPASEFVRRAIQERLARFCGAARDVRTA
jgi:hypothetical protein